MEHKKDDVFARSQGEERKKWRRQGMKNDKPSEIIVLWDSSGISCSCRPKIINIQQHTHSQLAPLIPSYLRPFALFKQSKLLSITYPLRPYLAHRLLSSWSCFDLSSHSSSPLHLPYNLSAFSFHLPQPVSIIC